MSDGYKRKVDNDRQHLIEGWRQTRLLAYLLVKKDLKDQNISLYDFWPLPNDPTGEDLERARKEEVEKDAEWGRKVIDAYRKRKVIK